MRASRDSSASSSRAEQIRQGPSCGSPGGGFGLACGLSRAEARWSRPSRVRSIAVP
jgi:hypothetical protein